MGNKVLIALFIVLFGATTAIAGMYNVNWTFPKEAEQLIDGFKVYLNGKQVDVNSLPQSRSLNVDVELQQGQNVFDVRAYKVIDKDTTKYGPVGKTKSIFLIPQSDVVSVECVNCE